VSDIDDAVTSGRTGARSEDLRSIRAGGQFVRVAVSFRHASDRARS
jgi:hypothetical protein